MIGQRPKRNFGLALIFALALAMPWTAAAQTPFIQEVFVDFTEGTITIVGRGFSDKLAVTLGTLPEPLHVMDVMPETIVVELPDVPVGDYLLLLSPSGFSCDDGKPTSLVFEYTGAMCSGLNNQSSKKTRCRDYHTGGDRDPVNIRLIGKNSSKAMLSPTDGINIFDQILLEGLGGHRLPSSVTFEIRRGSARLQRVIVHTSCSAPLDSGDRFGSLKLLSGTFDGNKSKKSFRQSDKSRKSGKSRKSRKPDKSKRDANPKRSGRASYDLTIDPSANGGGPGPGPGVTFYQVTSEPVQLDPELPSPGSASCDPGDSVTGGGHSLDNFFSQAVTRASRPLPDNSGWLVILDGSRFAGAGVGTFTVYAVCAKTSP